MSNWTATESGTETTMMLEMNLSFYFLPKSVTGNTVNELQLRDFFVLKVEGWENAYVITDTKSHVLYLPCPASNGFAASK